MSAAIHARQRGFRQLGHAAQMGPGPGLCFPPVRGRRSVAKPGFEPEASGRHQGSRDGYGQDPEATEFLGVVRDSPSLPNLRLSDSCRRVPSVSGQKVDTGQISLLGRLARFHRPRRVGSDLRHLIQRGSGSA